MDWKSLKNNATVWTAKATDMAKKWFETSKEYAEKTGVWSYEKLKESKFTLKDHDSYEKLAEEKRYAIFCIRDNDPFTKFFLTILPIIFTKAWIESGSLRILMEEGSENLRKTMEIDSVPLVIVKMNDGTMKKITTEEEIRTFIKDFSFYDKKDEKSNS